MNLWIKKIRNNTDSKQSEKLVIPKLHSSDKWNSSFYRLELIIRTIHSKKNGLTWLLYYTNSTTRFILLNIWGYLRNDQLNGMLSRDDAAETYIYKLLQPLNIFPFLSGHEQQIKNMYGFLDILDSYPSFRKNKFKS